MTGHEENNSLEPYQQINTSLPVPFPELSGECVEYWDKTTDGVIALSNYRLFVRFKESFVNRPLGLIESVEYRDIFYIHVCCKDAHSFKCTFETNERCVEWYSRLCKAITPPTELTTVFAYTLLTHCRDAEEGLSEHPCDSSLQLHKLMSEAQSSGRYSFDREVERLEYNLKSTWRIAYINEQYKVCKSYPQNHIVPKKVTDEDLKMSASFRGGRRFPSVVWRHRKNGAVIVRCAQPEMGLWGWRNTQDENIMRAIAEACGEEGQEARMLIVDARSYAAAVANRAKGGGCECIEYYPNCRIEFMSLANIHAIRKSFHAVRSLCSGGGDQTGWLQGLDTTKWLQHLSSLMRATVTVVYTLDREAQAALIHCSDGWDRTPQISALAQLLLDPYYRTHEGFRVLVEKEWLEFGHKFADRCGLGLCTDDTNERCPVFLQWLDAVHQLLLQFPRAFQFNESYLVKLAQHTYSNLFGTFLCNTTREREEAKVYEHTGSVWGLLHPRNRAFFNPLYARDQYQVLEPSYHLKDLTLWRAVYMYKTPPSAVPEDNFDGLNLDEDTPSENQDPQVLTKTRSCENLCLAAAVEISTPNRRLSDPNVIITSEPSSLNTHALSTAAPHSDATEKHAQGGTEGEREGQGSEDEQATTVQSAKMNGHVVREEADGGSNGEEDSIAKVHVPELKNGQDCASLKCVYSRKSEHIETNDSELKYDTDKDSSNEQNECDGSEDKNIPLPNESDITPEMLARNSTSTGSDATLVDQPGIAEDCRTLCESDHGHMNGNAPSADSIKGHDENCVDSEIVNGHCDTRETCSNGRKAARIEKENGQVSCDKSKCNGSYENESVNSHLCNGNVRTSHTRSPDPEAEPQLNGYCDSSNSSTPTTEICQNGGDAHFSPPTPVVRNNIRSLHAANMSTSTSDISDSHVSIKTNFVTGMVKANSLKEEDHALAKLELVVDHRVGVPPPGHKRRLLQLDVSRGLASMNNGRSISGSQSASSNSNTPSPSTDKGSGGWLSRQASTTLGVSRYLDVDGLNLLEDPYTAHAQNLHSYYSACLRRQQRVINTLLYHLSSGRNGASKCTEDLLAQCSDEEEAGSLGAHSNPASDISWEQVTSQDADMTLWVPDHVVTHCAGCDGEFWIARRKHHCRSCGQVFCGECARFYTPVPRQQLRDPVRVCCTCYAAIHPSHCAAVPQHTAADPERELQSAMMESTTAAAAAPAGVV